jgi:ribosomal protein S8
VELGGGFLAIAALLTLFVQTADGIKDNQRADKGKIGGDVVVTNS